MKKVEGYKVINIRIDEDLHAKFKSKVAKEKQSMQEAIQRLIAGYI